MEEDVEIELLLKSNEDFLMLEAFKLNEDVNNAENECGQNASNKVKDSYTLKQEESFNKLIQEENNEGTLSTQEPSSVTNTMNYNDEIQEILDDHIVSYMVEEPTKHDLQLHPMSSDEENYKSEYESDEGDQFINEIMSQSEQYGGSFMEHVKKVIGNKDSQIKYSAISELVSAHRLNIEKDYLLKRLEHRFQEELYSVEENIQHVRESISMLTVQSSNKLREPSFYKSYFRSFGAPYFKDSHGFCPSPNMDHANKLKKDNTAAVYIEKPFYWTKDHQKKLLDAIKDTLIVEKSAKLVKQIKQIKDMVDSSRKSSDDKLLENLAKCQQELSSIKIKSFAELMADENDNREFDWMKYSVSLYDGEHSPDECRRFWEVYLKPSVNKSNWEYAEDLRLLDISEELKLQDWDSIAKLLGTNRSAYQCFVHFQTRLNSMHDFSKGKWTKEEDETLLKVINASRIGSYIPWSKVSCHMGNRNHVQIYNRFVKCLDPKLVKGKFTKGEDLLIIAGIEVFGCNYKELCTLLNNRTYGQIRDRYERYLLQKTVRVGTWTLQEDEQLIKLVEKHGEQNWVKISKEMKFRTRTQTRQRYRFIQQNMKTKPGWTINNIKRRNVRLIDKNIDRTRRSVEKIRLEIHQIEQAFNLTKTEKDTFRIEKLKELRDKIQKKKYKVHRRKNAVVDHSVVNKLLNEFFKNDQIKVPESNKISNHDTYNNYFEDLNLLAKNFGHQLQIPDDEDEIINNERLNNSLKNVLLKSIKMKTVDASRIDSIPILSNSCETNIVYKPPESDTSIIHNDLWFTPLIDISRLNFSEYFKPTVFDYSCGMHKDIWKLKMKQPVQINFCDFAKNILEPPPKTQHLRYNMPPNHLTTLCYKSALLSRTRLKHDCKKAASEKLSVDESENNVDLTSDFDINSCLDVFQETLLTLFTWPRALSLCSVTTNAEKVAHFQENSISKLSHKSNVKRLKKLRKINLKQNSPVNCKTGLIRRTISCKRKMKIEHLLRSNVNKEEDVNPHLFTEASTIVHSQIMKPKMLKSNNENISPTKKTRFLSKKSKQFIYSDKTSSNKTNDGENKPQLTAKLKSSVNTCNKRNLSPEAVNISLKSTLKTYRSQQKRKVDSTSISNKKKKKITLSQDVVQTVKK